ncbi:type VII secretion system-associated protein [Streptomyces oryzae]|uniref:Type VII secretion system-associated protein n=1 Tax=Streptomyces oryzae TaxID=1434886 RepID=A0ABS3XIY9_9ACTN|nr:type VII secretion system-associated protein [Streptomyces oryzae]
MDQASTPPDAPAPQPEEPTTGQDAEEQPPTLVRPGEPGFPPPPEGIVEAAKLAPDHWLSVVDQEWNGKDGEEPPSWVVLGRWRTDENGEIVEWERNDDYRPSPERMGWPEPVSPADRAVQRAATGYGPQDDVVRALADADVAVCVDDEGRPSVSETPEGVSAVAVFSASPDLPPDELPPHEVMPMPGLLEQLADDQEVLFLSSSAPVALLIDKDALRATPEDAEGGSTGGTLTGSER